MRVVKGRKLYAVFMNVEKAHDRVDRRDLWNVLKFYDIDGCLLKRMRPSYKEASACVKVGSTMIKSFGINVGERQECYITLAL